MDTSSADGKVVLSFVLPAHNSAEVIEGTLKEVARRLVGTVSEIIVVENASSDGTVALLRQVQTEWVHDVPLRVLTSQRGIGNAFRAGIAASRGGRVLLTGDDLPFGFDDLDAGERLDAATHPVVIGSKAHPQSETSNRSLLRTVMTFGFLLMRRLVLGMHTRDPQGSFLLDGSWARAVCPLLREPGFLVTTELTYVAELNGLRPVEVPIRLRAKHDAHASRISLSDPLWMGVGLFGLRGRRRDYVSSDLPRPPR